MHKTQMYTPHVDGCFISLYHVTFNFFARTQIRDLSRREITSVCGLSCSSANRIDTSASTAYRGPRDLPVLTKVVLVPWYELPHTH